MRGPPPIPERSRFSVGDRARVIHTRFTFDVAGVSLNGETIWPGTGPAFLARQCERMPAKPLAKADVAEAFENTFRPSAVS